MSTHEPELITPVDLCTGRTLNPAARGWSRRPLHRGNLTGSWGRTKRWDYWAFQAGDVIVAITYADLDIVGVVGVWWHDLGTGLGGGHEVSAVLTGLVRLPERPGTAPLSWHGRGLDLDIVPAGDSTRITAGWYERGTEESRLDLVVDTRGESLNVVIPWSDKRFQYTQKAVALPTSGTLAIGPLTYPLENGWGVLDVGRGRWPHRSVWNWGAGSGHTREGAVVGLQLGGIWTEGTGFTENGVFLDGVLTKIGEELSWEYDWEQPLRPWRVSTPAGAPAGTSDCTVDATLTPRHDKHDKLSLGVVSREVHQVFGTWTGQIVVDGVAHRFAGIPGFAEESRARW